MMRPIRPGWMSRALALIALCMTLAIPAAHAQASSDVDPLEPLNRAVFSFNDALDESIIRPAAKAYVEYVPEPIRRGLGNFFSNLVDPWNGVNNLLQGKPRAAGSDIGRFVLNTLICLGLCDVATDQGFEKHNEDFGQTLGVWGFKSGPYLVLPIFGSSSIRDGIGRITDITMDLSREIPTRAEFAAFTAVRVVDIRASLLPLDQMVQGVALDRYTFFRNAYLQRRRNLVYDGNPPELDD